jgi:hypothetical protein
MTAVAYNYGYEDGVDITSYVTVRHAQYNYALVPRQTEIAAYDRKAYGGRHPATHSAALLDIYRNKKLKCSDCQENKPLYDFPRLTGCWHRYERGYQCSACKHLWYVKAREATREQRQEQKRLSKKERKQAKKKLDKRVA